MAAASTERIAIDELNRLVRGALLRGCGYSPEEAALIGDILLYAELHGNNQGISKLYDVTAPGGLALDPRAGELVVERETPVSAVVNGNARSGMTALRRAVELAVDKGRREGFSIVGTHGTFTSTGMLAYYAEQVAKHDLIAIVLAQSPELVAPSGGSTAVFGTNPICFAVPGGPDGTPVVLDMASAATTLFGLVTAKADGALLPEGCAIDRDGNPTRDPTEALAGALLTFGGPASRHKSSGLALMVELLGGVLPGGHPPGLNVTKKQAKNWANLVIAIDPGLVADVGDFKEHVAQVCSFVKSTGDQVFLPGEIEKARFKQNTANGFLDVSSALLRRIRDLSSASSPASAGPKPRL